MTWPGVSSRPCSQPSQIYLSLTYIYPLDISFWLTKPRGHCYLSIFDRLSFCLSAQHQGVLHRDIKGANILTTKDGHVKLADFGVAFKVNTNQSAKVAGGPFYVFTRIVSSMLTHLLVTPLFYSAVIGS